MHFLTQVEINGDDIFYIMNSTSWSSCLAYLEGTGGNVLQIIKMQDTVSVVLGDESTTKCYDVTLKDTVSQQRLRYVVFQNSYQSLQNWISQQTNKDVVNILFSEKTYVNV